MANGLSSESVRFPLRWSVPMKSGEGPPKWISPSLPFTNIVVFVTPNGSESSPVRSSRPLLETRETFWLLERLNRIGFRTTLVPLDV